MCACSCVDVVAEAVSGIFFRAPRTQRLRAHARADRRVIQCSTTSRAHRHQEHGRVRRADRLLQTMISKLRREPIGTSTIGLINVKCNSDQDSATQWPTGVIAAETKDEIECTPCWGSPLPASKWYGVKTGETIGPVKLGPCGLRLTDRRQVFFPVFDRVGSNGRAFHIIMAAGGFRDRHEWRRLDIARTVGSPAAGPSHATPTHMPPATVRAPPTSAARHAHPET